MSLKLNKKLYTDINRLKLSDIDSADVRFRLVKSPFTGNTNTEQLDADELEEYTITGQIFPKSAPYNERSYMIEMKLPEAFPMDPPIVRFITPIYHPNVKENGDVCNQLLHKTHKWTRNTSLVEVVQAVVNHIDHPDIDYSIRANVGKEYRDNQEIFNRKASENVKKYGLPR